MPASGPHDAVALDGAALTDAAERLLTLGTPIGDVDRVHTLPAEYAMTGRAGALDRAIRLLGSTEPDSGLGDREADFYSILGHALRDTERTALSDTAERAVAARRKARELTSKEDNAYPGRLADLGAVLTVQFRITGDASALKETVRVFEAAVRRFDPDDPVGPLPEPDLCCWCVGRRSWSAVAPAPRTWRARPQPEDRPPPVNNLVSRPSSYPAARPGLTHRDKRNVL